MQNYSANQQAEKLAQLKQQLAAKMQQEPAVAKAEKAAQLKFEAAVLKECAYVVNLVSKRPRSRGEIQEKLKTRAVPSEIREEVIARAQKNGLIDDLAFAQKWVQERSQYKLLGVAALRQELRRKQIDSQIIETVLAELDTQNEYAKCQEIVRAKIQAGLRQSQNRANAVKANSSTVKRGDFRKASEREKLINKVVDAAARRGYAPGVAFKIAVAELDALGLTLN